MNRKTQLAIATAFVATFVLAASARADAPDIKSSGPIAFAPDGVLLVADPQSAAIFAIETGDTKGRKKAKARAIKVEGLDGKLAAQLGTTTELTAFPFLLAQLEFLDLAGRCLGQLSKLHLLGTFEVR